MHRVDSKQQRGCDSRQSPALAEGIQNNHGREATGHRVDDQVCDVHACVAPIVMAYSGALQLRTQHARTVVRAPQPRFKSKRQHSEWAVRFMGPGPRGPSRPHRVAPKVVGEASPPCPRPRHVFVVQDAMLSPTARYVSEA